MDGLMRSSVLKKHSQVRKICVPNQRILLGNIMISVHGKKRNKSLEQINPGVDVVLNLVHCFYQPGEGPCGEPYFARHGFAGASKQWKCPVFATVVFFKPNISPLWPTGVYWNQGDKSTTKWRYSDKPIKPADSFEPITIEESLALVRMYNLNEQA
jgi:hypothetical protein